MASHRATPTRGSSRRLFSGSPKLLGKRENNLLAIEEHEEQRLQRVMFGAANVTISADDPSQECEIGTLREPKNLADPKI